MRLTPDEVAAIRESAREAFGPEVVVRVFGSRLDDTRRGGDIDLHVLLAHKTGMDNGSGRFRALLDRRVGEREYDIVVTMTGDLPSPVARKALAEGVIL